MRFPKARTLTLLDPVESQNEMRETILTYVPAGTIQGEIWPLRMNATRGLMGVTDTSTHQLYTTGVVVMNQRVIDGTNPDTDPMYLVQYVAPWGTHREAVLCQV